MAMWAVLGLALSQDPSASAELVTRFTQDRAALGRKFSVAGPARRERLSAFYREWADRARELRQQGLDRHAEVDALALENVAERELARLRQEEAQASETAQFLPFESELLRLTDAHREFEVADGRAGAEALVHIAEAARKAATAQEGPTRPVARRLVRRIDALKDALKVWYEFREGYDPGFTWWCKAPFARAIEALDAYEAAVRDKWLGVKEGDRTTIVGDPIGDAALRAELKHEMVPYPPERLIEMAEAEYDWCLAQMKRAARDLGFGDDWRAALEKVKTLHEPPGGQPQMIRDLAVEAIAFVEPFLTVPDLAKETWRMTMLSPEAQLVSPFFLGGETIQVSFPTDTMDHSAKLMSMRGNNRHFSRATVQHELIPGHHLQQFMNARYRPYRGAFYTPFWIEGWALYWEMVLWDKGFPRSPEDRIGMLFWRMHRCVRVSFSLGFHLGRLSPEQCVEMLVDRVGHERANAEAEVRRSFEGDYGPLYQIAYLIGGFQFLALRKELVDAGTMPEREFHDSILQNGNLPVALVRAVIKPEAPIDTAWAWAGD
jgi:hypothetical protein